MPNREKINSTVSLMLTPTILGGLVSATLTTALAGADNDLLFTAKVGGSGGNAITVRYTDPVGNNQALAVTVTELTINYRNGLFEAKDGKAQSYRQTVENFIREQHPHATRTRELLKRRRNDVLRALYKQMGVESK